MSEKLSVKSHKLGKIGTAIGAVTSLAFGLSVMPSPSATAAGPSKAVKLAPNMSGFHKLGNEKIDKGECYSGGNRPCYLLLRVAPNLGLSANIITANPDSPPSRSEQWPKEAYAGNPGDKLTIVCYDPNQELVTSYEGGLSSSDWYEVKVPGDRILNPAVKQNHHSAMLGYASIVWFNESQPNPKVPVCTA